MHEEYYIKWILSHKFDFHYGNLTNYVVYVSK